MISEVNKKETIDYIIHFLLQSNESLASYVHYLDKAEAIRECENYHRQIYIIRSHFFNDSIYGSEGSMPEWPLKKYKDMEILYGEAREEERNGNLLIYGDLIASSYFFLTRYEEMIRSTVRDIYGNYPARESLLYQINRLQVPVVDRYGELLCEKLKQLGYDLKETKNGFSKLYFTHDIDVPFSVYSFKNMIKAMGKSILKDRRIILYPLLNYMGYYGINPRSTWKYMLDRENSVGGGYTETESICFIVAAEKADPYTQAYINDKKIFPIIREMEERKSVIGLHTSYFGAESEVMVQQEKSKLESVLKKKVKYHRNHYLRQLHPSHMLYYENAEFTDDFTTGFNEMPGFRLGTCHPVRWINPRDGSLHDILLHGLQIMDGSLSGLKPYQLELAEEEARLLCKNMIDQIIQYHGELCVLWHNGMFEKRKENYQKNIYDWILDYCAKWIKKSEERNQHWD